MQLLDGEGLDGARWDWEFSDICRSGGTDGDSKDLLRACVNLLVVETTEGLLRWKGMLRLCRACPSRYSDLLERWVGHRSGDSGGGMGSKVG